MKLKVYTYCSYKFSPIGFQHGVFQIDTEDTSEEYLIPVILENDTIASAFVRNCFVEGVIQSAFGKIPEADEYLLIIKGLEFDYVNEDDMPAKKYGNFALSTNDAASFKRLKSNLDKLSKEHLSEVMNSFLIPDSNSGDTAIKIDCKQFSDFINGFSEESNVFEDIEVFNIVPTSYSDKALQALSVRFAEFSVIPTNNHRYQIKKKLLIQPKANIQTLIEQISKKIKDFPIIALIVMILILIGLILLLM